MRPRARAAAKPAVVRSAISSRSNSAKAAKMPKASLPLAVAGVDLGAGAGQHLEADTAQAQVLGRGDQVPEVAAEAIELPEHQGVAGLEGLQACQQAGPGIVSAGSEILVDALPGNAGSEHRVALRGERLAAIAFRNSDVADQHGRRDVVRKDGAQPASLCSFPQRVFSRCGSFVQVLTTSARKPAVFLVPVSRTTKVRAARWAPLGCRPDPSHAFCVGPDDLASVSPIVRSVSRNVRPSPSPVSANVRRK